MVYELRLVCGGEEIDRWDCKSDADLYEGIGRFSALCFLAIDSIDWKDSVWHPCPKEEMDARLLHFTVSKASDEPGYSRHGLPKGVLAKGHCWVVGKKRACELRVAKKTG